MNLTINGQAETITTDTKTIKDLLTLKDVKMPEMVTVEHNGEILDRTAFDTTPLKDGDQIEFLYFMGGGSLKTEPSDGFAATSLEKGGFKSSPLGWGLGVGRLPFRGSCHEVTEGSLLRKPKDSNLGVRA